MAVAHRDSVYLEPHPQPPLQDFPVSVQMFEHSLPDHTQTEYPQMHYRPIFHVYRGGPSL